LKSNKGHAVSASRTGSGNTEQTLVARLRLVMRGIWFKVFWLVSGGNRFIYVLS